MAEKNELADLRERMEQIERILHGNGAEGLRTTVAVILAKLDSLNTMFEKHCFDEEAALCKRDENDQRRDKMLYMLLGGVIVLNTGLQLALKLWKP